MKLSKFIFTITTSILLSTVSQAQSKNSINRNPKNAAAKRPVKKNFAQRDYKELHFSLSQISDKFSIDSNGMKGQMRSQLNGANLTYTLYRPSQNTKWLYSYGFGGTLGFAKGTAVDSTLSPIAGLNAKNKLWFAGSFVPGVDFRHSYRARVGMFVPLTFRALDFGFDDETKVQSNDPFSIGIGARYVNTISIRQAISFSFTHHITWSSSQWDLAWQYRLGI